MGKKLDLELAIAQGRFGEIVKYLDRRIDLLQRAMNKKCAKSKSRANRRKGKDDILTGAQP